MAMLRLPSSVARSSCRAVGCCVLQTRPRLRRHSLRQLPSSLPLPQTSPAARPLPIPPRPDDGLLAAAAASTAMLAGGAPPRTDDSSRPPCVALRAGLPTRYADEVPAEMVAVHGEDSVPSAVEKACDLAETVDDVDDSRLGFVSHRWPGSCARICNHLRAHRIA